MATWKSKRQSNLFWVKDPFSATSLSTHEIALYKKYWNGNYTISSEAEQLAYTKKAGVSKSSSCTLPD